MKRNENPKRRTAAFAGTGALLVAVSMFSNQSATSAQDALQAELENDRKSAMMSNCPMMTGLKGIKLVAESPPLLLARKEELKLTEEQTKELDSIAEEAQGKAIAVLTDKQREILGDSAGKPMSMMEIAMMRAKASKSKTTEGMCPMCQQKMDKMMNGMTKKRNENSAVTE